MTGSNTRYQLVTITNSIRILFIVLFVYAATSKLLDFNQFQIQLGQSPIVTRYASWVAWGIPIIELVISGLFLIPKCMLLAFYASFSLMILFTAYIILILNFSDYIPCSCGGVLEHLGWTEHIIFNLIFIIMAVIAIFYLERNPLTLKAK
ncbi:MauE/DoxX family redox-associated membrane protein [Changchengzhania lutea]|uniref:MauE/DoxX family redox-associated membrane protein n=1 Tax=Changchengzhania lutea TaxID=2049305 RepID=UPI00115F0609|nr:MauE/DoxX family redox-associated membrane protein [Changchengzhania lutea]